VSFRHDEAGTPAAAWAPYLAGLPAPDLEGLERLVVLAAHPDDESLGAGGLLARAGRGGLDVVVVAATDGEASHPDSPTHTATQLARLRRVELRTALGAVAPGAALHALGHPDGRLAEHEAELVARLVDLVGDGRRTLLVAPWRTDGHPDHEAAGRAAATAAARTGARLLEYPIWFWHWAEPGADGWELFRVLPLDDAEHAAKQAAQAAHRSQVLPLSEGPGDEVLLGADLLRHFAGRREAYVADAPHDAALDDLHADRADPWGVDSRWYETRKRALLLAALPRPRFRHGVEVGGSTGALARDLAARCDRLEVLDASPHAVAAARERLAGLPGVQVRQAAVPGGWPEAPGDGFDLVVLSEVGYFLSPADLDGLVGRVAASLAPDGVLVLAHWRHPVAGWPLDGADVHRRFTDAGLRPVVARYADRDVELLVLAEPSVLPEPAEGA